MKRQLPTRTIEHLSAFDVYIEEPEILVCFYEADQFLAVFGLWHCAPNELVDALLFRATELGNCTMVDPRLEKIKARLVTPEGDCWFVYDKENFCYKVPNDL